MVRLLLSAFVGLTLLAPATASAKVIRSDHYHVAYYTDRLSTVIDFIPVAGLAGTFERVDIRAGGDVHRGIWKSFTVSRHSTSEALRFMLRDGRGRHGDRLPGLFADRPLTARERRTFRVVADIARDADVLAVAKGHPACTGGLTMAQARDIAAGRATRWSQVGAGGADAPDAIRLGFTQRDQFERRFGTTRAPKGARRSADGGLTAAANGDRATAVVTRWSRVRFNRAVCAVPIGGVAPTDVSVHALDYPGAYAMTYVVHRRPPRPYERAKQKAFTAVMLSERVGKLWKRNGLILASERPAPPALQSPGSSQPAPAPADDGQPAPTSDGRGRPITASRNDDGVRAALAGERFDLVHDGGSDRYAFDSGGVFRLLSFTDEGDCSQSDGTWTLLGGWRYPEHGGGTIARVHISAPGTSGDATIDLPGDAPGAAYWNGQPYAQSRSAAGTC